MISHGSFMIFFKSPIFDIFLVLAVASLLFALYQRRKIAESERKNNLPAAQPEPELNG